MLDGGFSPTPSRASHVMFLVFSTSMQQAILHSQTAQTTHVLTETTHVLTETQAGETTHVVNGMVFPRTVLTWRFRRFTCCGDFTTHFRNGTYQGVQTAPSTPSDLHVCNYSEEAAPRCFFFHVSWCPRLFEQRMLQKSISEDPTVQKLAKRWARELFCGMTVHRFPEVVMTRLLNYITVTV